MKNIKLVYLTAGMIAFAAAPTLQAEDAKPGTPPNRAELREQFQNLTPEQREAKKKEMMEKRGDEMKRMSKELGLNPEELKNLSEEERRAKIKTAVEAKTTELEKKKAAGTLTDSEKETLNKLEMRKKFMEGRREGGPGPGAGRKPGAPKPSDK